MVRITVRLDAAELVSRSNDAVESCMTYNMHTNSAKFMIGGCISPKVGSWCDSTATSCKQLN